MIASGPEIPFLSHTRSSALRWKFLHHPAPIFSTSWRHSRVAQAWFFNLQPRHFEHLQDPPRKQLFPDLLCPAVTFLHSKG
ncbi:hypothetical protein GN956_G2532 [Arapaima gigas]